MRIGSETYFQLLNQLRMVAINSDNLEKRKRMRDNMLRVITRAFDASSSYICKHDFDRRLSIVQQHFISGRAKHRELESDLGCAYREENMGKFVDWLYGDHSNPRITYVQDLDADDPERAEYDEYDIATVITSALYYQGSLWGYLEIWDSRFRRHFKQVDLELMTQLTAYISDTILTEHG